MFRFTRALAVALAGLSLSAFQAVPPQVPPQLVELADDAAAAEAFDYMAFKATGADLRGLPDAIYMRARDRCLTAGEEALQMGLSAALEAPDAETFEADKVAAAEALARWDAYAEKLAGGYQEPEQPFASVASWYRGMARATTERERELYRRVAEDQLTRHGFGAGPKVWGELSPGAQTRMLGHLRRRVCGIDSDNTAWLKADLAANGWYRTSAFHPAASNAAWLMIQHADRDPAFQQEMLVLLEPLAAEGEIERSDFAYLFDRVAVNAGRPQRYGSQGRCVSKGVWAPNDLEDAERVQALRDDFNMGSLAEYTAHMHQFCADF
ncbi:hypothetical protein GGQ87_001159 [Brevundimonas alba]|uniref:DUF4034 domain-containing protein n=1 Tax=Brevundimonas alba TaxID=74314 RepID=A0A7X5YJ36_9CAUL|nr:DUF6624 domain-containing protein [Brevundimonas alba]NJC40901.1 hypothetical protein [Brevundimonas alba]